MHRMFKAFAVRFPNCKASVCRQYTPTHADAGSYMSCLNRCLAVVCGYVRFDRSRCDEQVRNWSYQVDIMPTQDHACLFIHTLHNTDDGHAALF